MATYTESFNKADSDTLGPDLTWTETTGDIDVVSNKASGGGSHYARAEHDLASNDCYAQALVGTDGTGNGYPEVDCRFAAAANTFYGAVAYFTEDSIFLQKMIAGTAINLGSAAHTLDVGTEYTLKVEANGTTIKAYLNGTEKVSVTDSAIDGTTVGGKRGGIGGFKGSTGRNTWDSFEFGDLGGAAAVVPYRTLMGVGV